MSERRTRKYLLVNHLLIIFVCIICLFQPTRHEVREKRRFRKTQRNLGNSQLVFPQNQHLISHLRSGIKSELFRLSYFSHYHFKDTHACTSFSKNISARAELSSCSICFNHFSKVVDFEDRYFHNNTESLDPNAIPFYHGWNNQKYMSFSHANCLDWFFCLNWCVSNLNKNIFSPFFFQLIQSVLLNLYNKSSKGEWRNILSSLST